MLINQIKKYLVPKYHYLYKVKYSNIQDQDQI